METLEEHDGAGWRLHLATVGDELRFTIEQEHDSTWLPTQSWTEPAPEPKHRRVAVTDSARNHGWIVPSDRWPRTRKDGTQILTEMFPFDWEQIVRDASEFRSETLAHAAVVDRAWRLAINAAGTVGQLKMSELAAASGRGRHAIYRMRTDDLGADDTALLTEIRNT